MSVDSKQFNRTGVDYEEVERHIQEAQRLRSEAIARGARRLGATLRAGARRAGAFVRDAVHTDGNGKKIGGAPC